MAHELGLKLGVTKQRLRRFKKLGVTSFSTGKRASMVRSCCHAPSASFFGPYAGVLVQLLDKLRAKLVVTVLRQMAAWRRDVEVLIEEAGERCRNKEQWCS